MISVSEVAKVFEDGTVALENVSFEVKKGESCAIIGESGCGKSTLLLILAGLLKPTRGEVAIDGSIVTKPMKNVSLILQDYGLFPWKNVYDNIALGLRIRRVGRDEIRRKVSSLINRLGLEGFERHYPKQLSGGMRQRVAFARALATNPEILLMDEPFSSLDALSRENLQNFLLKLWQENKITMVLVTHSIEEAVFLGKRIVVLTPRPGKVKAIVENPMAGSLDYRYREEYFRKCREIRRIIEAT